LRPKDVSEIMNHEDHYIKIFTQALAPLLTGKSLFLQEEVEN
jgi:hypothetical protein